MRRTRDKSVQSTSRSKAPKSVILINFNDMGQLKSPSDLISPITWAQSLSPNQGPFGLIKDMDLINYNYYV